MKKSYMTDSLCLNVVYNETVGLQARSSAIPAKCDSARTHCLWKKPFLSKEWDTL